MNRIYRQTMKTIVTTLIFCFAFFNNAKSQDSVFYLKQITYNSDFNYNAIKYIDTFSTDDLRNNILNLESGKYTIYVLDRETKGVSKDGINSGIKQEMIIMKAIKNTIVESYYFPLSWRESPISSVVLTSKKKIKIAGKLPTNSFLFNSDDTYRINILMPGDLIFKPR